MRGFPFLALVAFFAFVVFQPPSVPVQNPAEPSVQVAKTVIADLPPIPAPVVGEEVVVSLVEDLRGESPSFASHSAEATRDKEASEGGEESEEAEESEESEESEGLPSQEKGEEEAEETENIAEPVVEEEFVEEALEDPVLVLLPEEGGEAEQEASPEEASIVEQLLESSEE